MVMDGKEHRPNVLDGGSVMLGSPSWNDDQRIAELERKLEQLTRDTQRQTARFSSAESDSAGSAPTLEAGAGHGTSATLAT